MTTGSGAPGAGTLAKSFVSPLARSAACAVLAHAQTAATRARVRMEWRIPRAEDVTPSTLTTLCVANVDRVLRGGRFRLDPLPCGQPFVRAAASHELVVRSYLH